MSDCRGEFSQFVGTGINSIDGAMVWLLIYIWQAMAMVSSVASQGGGRSGATWLESIRGIDLDSIPYLGVSDI